MFSKSSSRTDMPRGQGKKKKEDSEEVKPRKKQKSRKPLGLFPLKNPRRKTVPMMSSSQDIPAPVWPWLGNPDLVLSAPGAIHLKPRATQSTQCTSPLWTSAVVWTSIV